MPRPIFDRGNPHHRDSHEFNVSVDAHHAQQEEAEKAKSRSAVNLVANVGASVWSFKTVLEDSSLRVLDGSALAKASAVALVVLYVGHKLLSLMKRNEYSPTSRLVAAGLLAVTVSQGSAWFFNKFESLTTPAGQSINMKGAAVPKAPAAMDRFAPTNKPEALVVRG